MTSLQRADPVAERPRQWAVVQHVEHEVPGTIASALADAGQSPVDVRIHRGDRLPELQDVGGVVVMGGPMGVGDDAEHPWLSAERAWLHAAVHGGLPVLGVCLGAQQLAAALGAEVSAAPQAEIGFDRIQLTEHGRQDPLFAGEDAELPVLQWHADMFAVPAGAVCLAQSPVVANQAFRWGRAVYGLQFHLEADRSLLDRWAPMLPDGTDLSGPLAAQTEALGRRVLRRFVELALS